ncbi:hypothetical protein K474DRAFT_1667435 [Panus rudis PR-1116 ss-1]|nr:hypothetical protein K474DRAFT_1667435 [Panus rudis PR-1116 ss-1]
MVERNSSHRLRFVYYCSGHGYGHATRVSAFACHLLNLDIQPIVHIVSSAPKHVFADSIALGALYRNAHIDPVIVQPLAYRVDRQKSVDVLRSFLQSKDRKVAEERDWLLAIEADCVLSDAAFLGCAAANEAGIPSVLITNFSFDSVYSYLSTTSVNQNDDTTPSASELLQASACIQAELDPDTPIALDEITPLVDEIVQGYRCADLLLRLPGAIPIPSFAAEPSLPSPQWVDPKAHSFLQPVIEHLTGNTADYKLLPSIPFPKEFGQKPLARSVHSTPLLVRSHDPSVYTPEGRSRLLDTIGVPSHLHDPDKTKILLVSFGGQIFHKPHSRSHSRTPSAVNTPKHGSTADLHESKSSTEPTKHSPPAMNGDGSVKQTQPDAEELANALKSTLLTPKSKTPPMSISTSTNGFSSLSRNSSLRRGKLRVAGAPPASIPASPVIPLSATFQSSNSATLPIFTTIPPTPRPRADSTNPFADSVVSSTSNGTIIDGVDAEEEDIPQLFPDDSWIAIVCGVSKDWAKEDGEELPDNLFVAPKDVYMPDLTAVADVLLGKLGYGTVSECVDSATPFVFVPRPLFIEEFGLRMLLERDGVGVEMTRTAYETGEWAKYVQEAWTKGKDAKARKRAEGETGRRKREGKEMATMLVEWVEKWKQAKGES